MLDFTSALYLGLQHASASLRPWSRFTTGTPAALAECPEAMQVAATLASLIGVERATLARSTLHAFWDTFESPEPRQILVDSGAYPIARWGAERAAGRGDLMRSFRHHDPDGLRRLIREHPGGKGPPWILTDGFCTGCGRAAPLADYLELARERHGLLIIDDTQALGILGTPAGPEHPYGCGGGGSLRARGVAGPEILTVSSLAKGFGVPLALVAGSRAFIERFERTSETRVHASPPSVADLRAAEHGLEVNRVHGDALRLRLASLVTRFRRGLKRLGVALGPSLFPLQRFGRLPHAMLAALHDHLLRLGIRTVMHRTACSADAGLAFLITARHTRADIDRVIRAIASGLMKVPTHPIYTGGYA